MLEELWDGLIHFTEQFVVPDWGALVALIPIGLGALVVLWVLWTVRRFATAGPTHRGIQRITPRPPAGVHAPGPSFAPILGAIGAFLLFLGLVVRGPALILGIVAFAITLLYWGREGIRDYEHLGDDGGPAVAMLPAPVERTPPPGIHLPGPSFLPILSALGAAILFFGIVFRGWVLVFGVIALIIGLAGWLGAAGREYRAAVAADQTGHLDAGPAPTWPRGTLTALAALVVVGLILNSGVLPIGSGAAAGASASPGASGGAAPPSASAPASQLPQADVTVTAQNTAFTQTNVSVPAGKPFKLAFDNTDGGQPHNIAVADVKFTGEIVTGPKAIVYDMPAMSPGAHPFICSVHPNMTGTFTAA